MVIVNAKRSGAAVYVNFESVEGITFSLKVADRKDANGRPYIDPPRYQTKAGEFRDAIGATQKLRELLARVAIAEAAKHPVGS